MSGPSPASRRCRSAPSPPYRGGRDRRSISTSALRFSTSRVTVATARTHAYAHNHQLRLEQSSGFEPHALSLDRRRGIAQVEDHSMLLMQRAHEIAELRSQDALHRSVLRRHNMDVEIARAQGSSNFE